MRRVRGVDDVDMPYKMVPSRALCRRWLVRGCLAVVWLALTVSSSAQPANDPMAGAVQLVGTNLTVTGSNVQATKEPGEANHAGYPGGASVWWKWAVPGAGYVTLDLRGSFAGALVGVYRGKYVDRLTPVASNTGANSDDTGRVRFRVEAGEIAADPLLQIAVDGLNAKTGDIRLHLEFSTIDQPPVLVAQPEDVTIQEGQSASFAVAVASLSAVSYQWQFNGFNQAGATNASLTLDRATVSQAGGYQVVARNEGGSVTSRTAVLTVNPPPPRITQAPKPVTVIEGQDANFVVVATGQGFLFYQWIFNGTDLPGATNALLTLPGVRISQQGAYAVRVSNAGGSVSSFGATLKVIQRPLNDNFANAILLTGTNVVSRGSNQYATAEPGEPRHAGREATASVWWAWTAPADGVAQCSLSGSYDQANLAVYTGDRLGTLVARDGTADLNADGTPQLQVLAQAAVTYHVAVDGGPDGGQGAIQLSLRFYPQDLPPEIQQQPQDTLVVEGQSTNLMVVANSISALSYQWTFQGALIPGATNAILALDRVRTNQAGVYQVTVANRGGSRQSRGANLIVIRRPINDDFTNRIAIPALNLTMTGNNRNGTLEPLEVRLTNQLGGATVWWRWVSVRTGWVELDPAGSFSGAVAGAYTGAAVDRLEPVFGFFQVNGDGTWRTRFLATTNIEYQIAIDGAAAGRQGDITFQLVEVTAPVILKNPVAQVVPAGGTAGFGLGFGDGGGGGGGDGWGGGGGFDCGFQWLFDGAAIPGATNATLIINNVTPADAGIYTVVLTNEMGTTVSKPVALVIQGQKPLITVQPQDATVLVGQGATFVVEAVSGTPLRYQWKFNGQALAGQTDSILRLSQLTANQAGDYTVEVGNSAGTVTSRTAVLKLGGRPPNDDFANRLTLAGTNAVASGSNENATREPGEPRHGGGDPATSVWWTWTAPGTGVAELDLEGSFSGAILGVYTGDRVEALNAVTGEFARNPDGTARRQFPAVSGTAYQIAVDGGAGASQGQVKIHVTFWRGGRPPEILAPPQNLTVVEGQNAVFSVRASSASPMSYQWKFNGVAVPGATNLSLTLVAAKLNQRGAYQVEVSNENGATLSSAAQLNVLSRPVNDDFVNRLAVTGAVAQVSGANLHATGEAGEPAHGNPAAGASVWWRYPTPDGGVGYADLKGSFYGAIAAVYTGAPVDRLTRVPVTPTTNTDGTLKVRWAAAAGGVYAVAVDGNQAGRQGDVHLSLLDITPPVIAIQPKSQRVAAGDSPTLGVVVSSVGPVSYQWRFNDGDMAGATNAVLSLPNLSGNQIGVYQVSVSNEAGTVTSQPATLAFASVIKGQVTDALDGHALPGVLVAVGTNTTYTDSQGNYQLTEVSPGTIRADFDSDVRRGQAPLTVRFMDLSSLSAVSLNATTNHYFPYANDQLEFSPGRSVTLSFSMSPIVRGMRMVLNWGAEPRDLDAHLITPPLPDPVNPADPGQSYHVYFNTRGKLGDRPYAVLDTDETNGFGPETITIADFSSGTYVYYAHKYAGLGGLASSGATVKIYTEAGLARTVQAPADGVGAYWHICNVDGDTRDITLVNRIGDQAPAGVGLLSLTSFGGYHGLGKSGLAPLGAGAGGRSIASYAWDFGDGHTSTLATPTNTYANPGQYTVRLTIEDSTGMGSTETKTNFITVLSALIPPAIVKQPAGVLTNQGAPVSFDVRATGSLPLLYQWYYQDQPIGGATNRILAWNDARLDQEGAYRVTVSNAAGATNSAPALLTVLVPPVITEQPVSQSVPAGQTVTLKVMATGTEPLAYQWSKGTNRLADSARLAGSGAPQLVISGFQASDEEVYTVTVTNRAGAATSHPAVLSLSRSRLYGQVTDAVNGSALAEVWVSAAGLSALTDGGGNYAISNLPPGTLRANFDADVRSGTAPLNVSFFNLTQTAAITVKGGKSGYLSYANAHVQIIPGGAARLDFSLSPSNVAGLRIVLNWGAFPRDLDAHLLTPEIEGKRYEIYYPRSQRGNTNAPPYAQLDVDRTEGFGPETITIPRFEPGIYRYFVRNYKEEQGNTGELTNSTAVVQIYSVDGLIRTINAPPVGRGDYWDVCAIDGRTGNITLINRILDAQPAPASLAPAPGGTMHALGADSPDPNGIRYVWDFGDGTTSLEENPLKTYLNPGTYDVALRATTADGQADVEFKARFLSVLSSGAPVRLRASRSPGGLVIEWTAEAGFWLESADDLNSRQWTRIAPTSDSSLTNSFPLGVPTKGALYFRLRKL